MIEDNLRLMVESRETKGTHSTKKMNKLIQKKNSSKRKMFGEQMHRT